MTSYNKVILMGNLTRDPHMNYTPGGTAVATFSLAVNRKYKQGDETKEEVSYIDVVVYGKQAENCGKYLFKGSSAIIEGRLQQRRWDDKETGAKRSKVEVAAQAVTFMPKSANRSPQSAMPHDGVPGPVGQVFEGAQEVNEGDIPF